MRWPFRHCVNGIARSARKFDLQALLVAQDEAQLFARDAGGDAQRDLRWPFPAIGRWVGRNGIPPRSGYQPDLQALLVAQDEAQLFARDAGGDAQRDLRWPFPAIDRCRRS
ncbi:MAG: hypothetical protein M9918_11130 [Anaerolineae bacterium]|nr:hypothetical protein [Anaerolineae bacterium]